MVGWGKIRVLVDCFSCIFKGIYVKHSEDRRIVKESLKGSGTVGSSKQKSRSCHSAALNPTRAPGGMVRLASA